jgi:hypothetical protein
MLVSNTHKCCKCAFSSILRIGSALFTLFPHPVFILQIVEMSLPMAQDLLQVRIAVSHVQAMRVRLVVLVIALTCIGVVRPPHLHLKSCQALESGLL